jgi:hypothetical protein
MLHREPPSQLRTRTRNPARARTALPLPPPLPLPLPPLTATGQQPPFRTRGSTARRSSGVPAFPGPGQRQQRPPHVDSVIIRSQSIDKLSIFESFSGH